MGAWPDMNTELVTDYGRPPGDRLRQFLRIHLDIPIPSKFTELQKALDGKKEGDVYRIIQGILPTETRTTKRAHAVVVAALKPD